MTRIDTDLYHLLCVMAGIGTVAGVAVIGMWVDSIWERIQYWRVGRSVKGETE